MKGSYIYTQLILSTPLAILLLLSCYSCDTKLSTKHNTLINVPSAIGTTENPNARFEFEIRQLVDPYTNKIPQDIFKKQLEYSNSLANQQSRMRNLRLEEWHKVGPSNVGGRTRALAIDSYDDNILLAGGVSGGMYRSDNGGRDWVRTSQPNIINSISCITQDTRFDFKENWYFGSGELKGNSARSSGAPYRGDGIFHSDDGGLTWQVIPSTSNGQLANFESPFNYVWNIELGNDGSILAALYGCIVKSSDGGNTWKTVLGPDLLNSNIEDLNDSGAPFYSNILKSKSGNLYATLSSFTALDYDLEYLGFYKSIDNGETWVPITPPDLPALSDRTVMASANTDEDIIYFFTQGGNESTYLWRYANDSWQSRHNNIPGKQDGLDVFDSQDSYNMVLGVHPQNSDLVFLGGTNLYRSTDGFATSSQTSWIGGYSDDEDAEYGVYENHHPDQHVIEFYSGGNEMLTGNDGGVYFTSDNTESEISWVSRNENYITSQFYSIAVSKVEGDPKITGGLQDNGSHLKSQEGTSVAWNKLLGGDGGYVASTPNNQYWYASFQNAQIFRLSLDEDSQITEFAEVDPIGIERDDYLFITPFVLDPNNYNRMYLAANDRIYRNDNLSLIPPYIQEPTDVGWNELSSTSSSFSAVSALDISTQPENILYYGTAFGTVHKVLNPNSGEDSTTSIFQYVSDLRASGYISNVTIDPTDANRVMVTYSNYNFPSIFMTNDGGDTFEQVSGNLEENENGIGNGPSVGWSEIIPLNDGSYKYFVGTSIGLFSTSLLDGNNTIWVKEGNETIGNAVIKMMDYRSQDGRLVVSTHGNGVFETSIENTLNVSKNSDSQDNEDFDIIKSYPNPMVDSYKIVFNNPETSNIMVDIVNSMGQKIITLINGQQFEGDVTVYWDGLDSIGAPVDNGIYYCRVIRNGKQKSRKVVVAR